VLEEEIWVEGDAAELNPLYLSPGKYAMEITAGESYGEGLDYRKVAYVREEGELEAEEFMDWTGDDAIVIEME